MSLRQLDPPNIKDFIIINNHIGFKQTNIDITLFWLLCLAALITKEYEDRFISQFSYDIDLFWLNSLDDVALGLIPQMTISFILICRKLIDKKVLLTIFCLVFISTILLKSFFKILKILYVFKKKLFSIFSYLHISNFINITWTTTQKNNKNEDIIVFFLFLFSSILCFLANIQLAHHINKVFYQLFLTFPIYQTCAKDSLDKLQKKYSNFFSKQTIHLLLYKTLWLLCYWNLSAITINKLAVKK